ncbi:carbohydrate-binding module family 48 protein [Cystobasidium minutum MCA 4210]|uniref:carbohydrate-binding module family 48 protein n=1 Tax=Cystobasidium minutum MCA 4210 TaxID=1397322 RepID=UPI0034CD53A0|eukprot:jgi/Rhomi1/71295/CE71294_4094
MAVKYTKDFILYDVSPDEVYLSGSWCDWKPNAVKMTKIPNLYFIATVELPYNTKIAYKYIVNGNWMTNPEEQTETDAAGNTNNVFTITDSCSSFVSPFSTK